MKEFFANFKYAIKYVAAIAIFVVSIGFVGEHCITERVKRKQEIAQLQQKINEQKQRFAEDQQMLNSLKNDPEAVRRIAREKYYMKTANEDVFIIEDEN